MAKMALAENLETSDIPLILETEYLVNIDFEKDKPALAGLLSLLGSYARTKKIESIKIFNRFNPELKFVSEKKGKNLTCYLGDKKKFLLKRNMLLDGRDMYELVASK